VRYTKKCTTNVSNILVRSLTQVYIPVLTVSLQIMARKHEISLCGNPEKIEIIGGSLKNCEVCGNNLPEKRLLCNSCGKIVHKPRIILGHSYFCYLCKKTICIECARAKHSRKEVREERRIRREKKQTDEWRQNYYALKRKNVKE
jgi:hypothetical protein